MQRSASSTAALRYLFSWIERQYGGNLPVDKGSAAEVIARDRFFLTDDLLRLAKHQASAIHVRQFYPATAAKALGKNLEIEAGRQAKNWKISTVRGLESSDVATVGAHAPYNVVAATPPGEARDEARQQYFEGVQVELRKRRMTGDDDNGAPPQLWPLDLLRLQLDEQWPGGAGLARDTTLNKPFSGGLPRVMRGPTRWRQGYIHVDEMAPLNAERGLLSANIYLQLPTNQFAEPYPALHLWPIGIRSRWDWYRNALLWSGLSSHDPEAQFRLRQALGEPHTINVQPGDLILLSPQRPHAAVGFNSGVRVSLQCFVQYNGVKERLLIDT